MYLLDTNILLELLLNQKKADDVERPKSDWKFVESARQQLPFF